jgi:site-specific recombinase XerD
MNDKSGDDLPGDAQSLRIGPFNVDAILSGLSEASRRVYRSHLERWHDWAHGAPLDRERVESHMRSLQLEGRSAQVRNQSLAALKYLAMKAAQLGWIDSQTADQVQLIKTVPITETRTRNWLNAAQSSALLMAPDRSTLTGRRDAAVIALLLGCGLERAEACALKVEQVALTTQGRMFIVDLAGRSGQVRNVSVPLWAVFDIQRWIEELAALEPGQVLRSITRSRTIQGSLSPAAVRDIVRRYGAVIGLPDLSPHDLRRSHSRMARSGGAPIEVIQKTLGHASIRTTERYIQAGDGANAGDYIDIKHAGSRPLPDQSDPLPVQAETKSASQLEPSPNVPRRGVKAGRRPNAYPDLNYRVVSAALGVQPSYLGRVLNGRSRPSMEMASKLAALMGWTLDQVNGFYDGNKTRPEVEDQSS